MLYSLFVLIREASNIFFIHYIKQNNYSFVSTGAEKV
jgi:hypothetical protein